MSGVESEREWVAKAIAGDHVSLEQLLLKYYPELSGRLKAKLPGDLRSAISVDDVLQETFIHAFRDIGRFQPEADHSFAAWLRAVADHRLQDAIKTERRKKRGGWHHRVEKADDPDASSLIDFVEMLSAGSSTPSRYLARREAIQAVQVAIAGLPEDYRQAVQLHFLDGKSLEEVAVALDRTPGAVRGLLDRAKKKMRAALDRSSLYLSKK